MTVKQNLKRLYNKTTVDCDIQTISFLFQRFSFYLQPLSTPVGYATMHMKL